MAVTDESKSKVRSFLTEEVQKWAVRTMLLCAATTFLWIVTPLHGKALAIWNSPEQLAKIEAHLIRLTDALDKVTGEARVIRQPPGQSYVTEPVVAGQPVTLNLVVQRTTFGAGCRLVTSQPIFTDSRGVPTAGKSIGSPRQIGVALDRVRTQIQPPDDLVPGRIELYLALDYDCAGRFVPDRTDTVYYTLLEG